MGLSLRELIFLPSEIADLAKATKTMATNHANSADFYRLLVQLSSWHGQAADTAAESMLGVAGHHDTHAEDLMSAADTMGRAETDAEAVADKVRRLLAFAAERPAVQINEDTNTVTPPDTSYLDKDAAQQVAQKVTAAQEQMTKALADGAEVDGELGGAPSDAPPKPTDQHGNQVAAFHEVYGHDPVTPNDWQMAAALDPHSYDPKYLGKPPQIVAGRFTPQPGKGVVRSNMFIPADQVQNTAKDLTDLRTGRILPMNYGDNRGPSATASVEASRVSVFVDYDHGIVVTRQNPTVNIDGQRGGAQAAVPNVHVVQAADGRLTIDYNAADAYEWPVAEAAGITVNGHLTLVPHADGTVGIGGNTTIYPSMETYQYREGMPPAELQWTPANSGSPLGPGSSLPRHHWIGDSTIPSVRPDMPGWQWELENAIPFVDDPFLSHTTQLTDPANGALPTIGTGR